jgi:hypothetical protein
MRGPEHQVGAAHIDLADAAGVTAVEEKTEPAWTTASQSRTAWSTAAGAVTAPTNRAQVGVLQAKGVRAAVRCW